ncbi:MAG: G/U mismatch-specific DNA glycosylase [Acidobacteriota bacterium]
MSVYKPTKEELHAAAGKGVADVIAPDLLVLFCGINPGLYTAAIGHHFGRPGNRFWPTLYHAGFTKRLLSPFQENELLTHGYGITNIVNRATASADELSPEELIKGGEQLIEKIRRYRPIILAILGVGAYRTAFRHPKALLGKQPETIGETLIWVLPNTSGLNAHYQSQDLTRLFQELYQTGERLRCG